MLPCAHLKQRHALRRQHRARGGAFTVNASLQQHHWSQAHRLLLLPSLLLLVTARQHMQPPGQARRRPSPRRQQLDYRGGRRRAERQLGRRPRHLQRRGCSRLAVHRNDSSKHVARHQPGTAIWMMTWRR